MKEFQRFENVIHRIIENVYNQGYENGLGKAQTDSYVKGYEDGKAATPFTDTEEAEKTAYEQGLNDAWECAKKLCQSEKYGGFQEHCAEIFGREDVFDVFDYSASRCIEKVKAFEFEQKCKECKKTKDPIFYGHCVGECDYAKQTEDEIKVGDEVIVQVDRIGFVTGFAVFDRVYVTTKDGWSDAFGRSFVKKTGRHFDAIPEVLKQMNREGDK